MGFSDGGAELDIFVAVFMMRMFLFILQKG
jgi:hypothetical protein